MSSAGEGTAREREDAQWAEAAVEHFRLAADLMSAALSLELACVGLDDDGDWLYCEFGQILPSDDQDEPEYESDREFLLDRAATYRSVAETCLDNGVILADILASSLRGREGVPDSWNRRDELRKALGPYANAVGSGSLVAERALNALDRSTSSMGVEDPADSMRGIVQFLNAEAAVLSEFGNQVD